MIVDIFAFIAAHLCRGNKDEHLKTQVIFKIIQNDLLVVGAFNPVEKDYSKWESSPDRDEHKTYFETTT